MRCLTHAQLYGLNMLVITCHRIEAIDGVFTLNLSKSCIAIHFGCVVVDDLAISGDNRASEWVETSRDLKCNKLIKSNHIWHGLIFLLLFVFVAWWPVFLGVWWILVKIIFN